MTGGDPASRPNAKCAGRLAIACLAVLAAMFLAYGYYRTSGGRIVTPPAAWTYSAWTLIISTLLGAAKTAWEVLADARKSRLREEPEEEHPSGGAALKESVTTRLVREGGEEPEDTPAVPEGSEARSDSDPKQPG